MDKSRSALKLALNAASIALVAAGLWWAQNNLDGYKIQVLNLIAVNAILALSLNLVYCEQALC